MLLETLRNMMTNAHLHYKETFSAVDFRGQAVCFCAGSEAEFAAATSFARAVNGDAGGICAGGAGIALVSAGVHPWTLKEVLTGGAGTNGPLLGWLESLFGVRPGAVAAVGECGIDLYTPEFKELLPMQRAVFEMQMDFAALYKKPLVIHMRKALEYMIEYSPQLRKVPAVLFHSFPGSIEDCKSILSHSVNAFFSFGSGFMRGGKKAAECIAKLSAERLLLETDDEECAPSMIAAVFEAAAQLRGVSVEELCAVCEKNFRQVYLR